MEKKRYFFSLTSGLIDIVAGIAMIIKFIMMIAERHDLEAVGSDITNSLTLFWIIMAVLNGIVLLILGALSVINSNETEQRHIRKAELFLTAAILVTVLTLIQRYDYINEILEAISIISCILMVLATVFHWIEYAGISNAKARIAKRNTLRHSDFEKLSRLEELEKSGAIAKDEYEQLRKKIVENIKSKNNGQ